MYKVLIVDDEERIRNGLKLIIHWKSLGFSQCETAENGRTGIAKAREIDPDLIIADLRMPGIDGIQMIRQLREEGFRCQVMILSGVSDFQYAKEAIDLKVAAYLLKPINEDEMTGKIMQLFSMPDTENADITAPDKMTDILNYIEKNYDKSLKLHTVAGVFHYSIPYLGRVFKKATGETFHNYLEKLRMERAKEFLAKGHKVYVVAKMVGYSNVDYFSDKFKTYTGISPNDYKKQ